jgi:hypothetical protein
MISFPPFLRIPNKLKQSLKKLCIYVQPNLNHIDLVACVCVCVYVCVLSLSHLSDILAFKRVRDVVCVEKFCGIVLLLPLFLLHVMNCKRMKILKSSKV